MTASPVTAADRTAGGAAIARELADESERLGTLAPAAEAAMRESGLFWILLPAEMGGLGASVTSAMDVFEAVSRADGSSGWTLMANSLATAVVAAYCGDEAIERIFGPGDPTSVVAGMLGPGRERIEVDGGYRGSGP